MALATYDEYVTAMAQRRQDLRYSKASIANMVAGNLCSLWRATGYPAQPSIPGAASAPTDATSGPNPAGRLATWATSPPHEGTVYVDAVASGPTHQRSSVSVILLTR